MTQSRLKMKAATMYPQENITTTIALGHIAGVTLIPPSASCIYWMSEEELQARNRKRAATNPWGKNHKGFIFCFENHDKSKFRCVFDRSYGFISEDEYNTLTHKRTRRFLSYPPTKPTLLFSKIETVSAFVGLEGKHTFRKLNVHKISATDSTKNLATSRKRKFSMADLQPQNLISTILLGKIAGVSLAMPDEYAMQWQSILKESEEQDNNKVTENEENLWANENHHKTFYFEREDGSQFNAVFDRIFGFLAEEEFHGLEKLRSQKKKVSPPPTALFSELSRVQRPKNPTEIPSAFPQSNRPDNIQCPASFQCPPSVISSLATLFGRSAAQAIYSAKRMRLEVDAGERNNTPPTHGIGSRNT